MTTTGPGLVRDAVPDDAVRCAEIYAPYVRDTAISFETEPPTAADMARRIADAQRDHAWLVLEDGGELTGYAYGGPFMSRAAYRWSATVASTSTALVADRAAGVSCTRRCSTASAPAGSGRCWAAWRCPTRQVRGCTGRWASNPSAPTAGWAGSTAGGTTSSGTSGISSTGTRHPSRCADRPVRGPRWQGMVRGWTALPSVGPRRPPAGQRAAPPVVGRPDRSHARKPPMTSVARCRPSERRASAARLEV